MIILGFDIGGTKCAVITARWDGRDIKVLKKKSRPTNKNISPEAMMGLLIADADSILQEAPDRVGISCGGPLDSKKGVIMSPPNLPGWDNVEIVRIIREHYSVPTFLQNDANASALAEWKFGAGRGTENMIFLTFGTGLGAGLILGGRLYEGTNGNAGEVGHIRLCEGGPEGYGKKGSFEGFCSGGGIGRAAYEKAVDYAEKGEKTLYFTEGMSEKDVTARAVAEAAEKGDKAALEVFSLCAKQLGRGLSLLIDILNPEIIVIGSVFARSEHLLREGAEAEIKKEALDASRECCKIVPAALGEKIGDYAALSAAIYEVNL